LTSVRVRARARARARVRARVGVRVRVRLCTWSQFFTPSKNRHDLTSPNAISPLCDGEGEDGGG